MGVRTEIKWEIVTLEAVSYCTLFHRVPVLKQLEITGAAGAGFRLEVSSAPEFMRVAAMTFDGDGAPQDLAAKCTLELSAQYFLGLNEEQPGELVFRLYDTSRLLSERRVPLRLLPYQAWLGASVMPELAAAHLAPDAPAVSKVAVRAGKILAKWSKAGAGYAAGDSNAVRLQAAAVYEALAELAVKDTRAARRMEEVGTLVKSPAQSLDSRSGDSLELSLLYCSCLESLGLNPVLLLFENSAAAGVWLDDECCTECVSEDASYFTKKSADGIAAFSAVLPVFASGAAYDEAEAQAKLKLAEREKFLLAVDVARCRAAGVRPLPERALTRAGWTAVEGAPRRRQDEPRAVNAKKLVDKDGPERTEKLRNWERKLLDLSLRNLLLNMRVTNTVLPLCLHDVAAVEDAFAEEKEFTALPLGEKQMKQAEGKCPFELSGEVPFRGALTLDFRQKLLRAPLTPEETEKHLTSVYRAAKQSLEENGANTLYLALGALRWFENDKTDKPRYSPLILIPLEMVRRSAKKGYAFRLSGDEAMANVTLVEMLKQDFGKSIAGLDPLPKDEKNIDVQMVFSVFREAVMDLPGWDVLECGCIGIFSFNKFIMWQSLRTLDTRANVSRAARALEHGTPLGNILQPVKEGKSADALIAEQNLAIPVQADASQIAAVAAADRGESFVLHGPPGTGKSQTITNIIANALFKGKRVLFVAEKMAALQVVQRRLEKIGLGAFCLELHSAKSNKRQVLDQFKRAVDTARTVGEEDYREASERLSGLKAELSSYVAELYRPYPFGVTLQEAIGEYFALEDVRDRLSFQPQRFKSMTREQWTGLRELARSLVVTARAAGHPYRHPLSEITATEYSVAAKTDAEVTLAVFLKTGKDLSALSAEISRVFSGKLLPRSQQEAEDLSKLLKLAEKCARVSPTMLDSDVERSLRLLAKIIDSKERELELKGALLARYTNGIYDLDSAALLKKYAAALASGVLARGFKKRKVKKVLKRLLKEGQKLRGAEVNQDLLLIDELQKLTRFLNDNFSAAVIMLGGLYRHDLTDWAELKRLTENALELFRMFLRLTDGPETATLLMRQVPKAVSSGVNLKLFEVFETRMQSYRQDREKLASLLGVDFTAMSGPCYFDAVLAAVSRWQKNFGGLREWCAYLKECRAAEQAGIGGVVKLYESEEIPHEQILPAFDKALYKACILYILSDEEDLNAFSSDLFRAKVKRLADASRRFMAVSEELTYSRLAEKLPSFQTEANAASELGVFQRAIKNGGRGITIRKLFTEMPNLIHNLAPCMLMSPLSVAQYLDPAASGFDLVIFDEASQMPSYEAVVPLSLAEQCIVVGDPKQLPPTTFFMNTYEQEEDFFGDDLESVLDDLMALGLAERHLLWHYRSRHESLIAFSNKHYYGGQLMTFPSPGELVSSVRFIKCSGVYERGGTKQNRGEAEAVVAEVVRRLKDAQLSKRSIGIVTFSSVQQNLIEDLLQEEFKRRPSLEQAATEREEPLFVKNLENVQGDERDVIIFSIGYGKDASGRLSLNFGPLNREGGYRRLNVAVSRAKYEMLIYSSIEPEDINAARTNSVGVANLKAFLEYAKYGRSAAVRTEREVRRAGVGANIAKELECRGYAVKTDVGASKYRIDVAVVHPKRLGEYALGILLDGETYRSFESTTDREVSQYKVLEGLGWNVLRVWSLDYLDNKEKVLTGIVERIQSILNGTYAKIVEAEEKLNFQPKASETRRAISKGRPYDVAQLPIKPVPGAEFVAPQRLDAVTEQLRFVVEEEGPIAEPLLFKRVLLANGIQRMTPKVSTQLADALKRLAPAATEFNGVTFYWPGEGASAAYDAYRIAPEGGERRQAAELPYEELKAAVRETLQNQISLYRQDLVREVVRALGFERVSPSLSEAVTSAVDRMKAGGEIREDEATRVSF